MRFPVSVQKYLLKFMSPSQILRPKKETTKPDDLKPSLPLAYFLESNVSIFSDIVLTLQQEVFRQGISWKAKFACKCAMCGTEYQEKQTQCTCGCIAFVEPDRSQIQLFSNPDGKSFLETANLNGLSLKRVLRQHHRHLTVADVGYLLCVKEYRYVMQPDGSEQIIGKPVEFVVLDPRSIEEIKQENGLPGGKVWVCLEHRSITEDNPNRLCRMCGRPLHEAFFVTTENDKKYYIKDEIRQDTLFYYPAFPPILKFLYESYTFFYINMREYNHFKKGRMSGFLAVPTSNLESLEAALESMKLKAQEDPDDLRAFGYEPGQGKGAAQFIQLLNSPGAEMLEVKKELRERLGSLFGVSLIFQGDTSASGGLNNEGLQVTVTNRAIEFRQSLYNGDVETNYNDGILAWICSQFGITDFVLQLNPSEEQDEMAEKQQFAQDVQNAKLMFDMGFDVQFENDKFTFSGQAKQPQPAPAMPGLPMPAPQTERVSGAPLDVHKEDVDEFDEFNNDELVKAYSNNVYQAIKQGALYYNYEGVSEEDVQKIHAIIKEAFAIKRLSLREMVEKIVEVTALDEAQAAVIVRTETSAVANSARELGWKKMEQERDKEYLYKWSVAHDHRTSDICLEIESRVGAGVPLEKLKEIVRDVSQKYIPGWSGWAQLVAHPNERSTPVRVVR